MIFTILTLTPLYSKHQQEGRGARIASTVVNDYCFICPSAMRAVRDLMNVSPVFAYQFIIALCEYYKKPPDRRRDGADRDGDDTRRDGEVVTWNNGGWCDDGLLPPSMLVDLIADWIIEKPDFCLLNIPRVSFVS